MREVRIRKHTLMLYDSIENLPIVRYNKYTKYIMLEGAIGSEFGAFERHIERVVRYMGMNDTKKAVTELNNLRQSLYFGLNETNMQHLSFACLIHSIDGEELTDLTDEGLRQVIDRIGKWLPQSVLTDELHQSKKKIDGELALYFPKMVDTSGEKNYHAMLHRRSELILQNIIEGKDRERTRKIEELSTRMITFSNPIEFTDDNNAEIRHEKNFEQSCVIMQRELHCNPKKYTVMEFYNAMEYLNSVANEQKKKYKRGGK